MTVPTPTLTDAGEAGRLARTLRVSGGLSLTTPRIPGYQSP
jgi:hypothetical protein